jgi:hypothetical protein
MHWESWLEKVNTSSDGTDLERSNIDDSLLLDTDKPKKKVPLRMDDDKGGAFDDSGFYNKSEVNKILGAIAGAVGGAARAVGAAGKVVGEAVGRGAQGLGEAASAGGQSGGESASETLSTTSDEVGNFLDDVKDESNSHLETIKSWETWLEKGRWDNPKHDTNTQKEFEAFEKLSKLPKNEVTELGDAIDEAIEGVKSGKLKKNNAIETSHKEGEKKEEWNGKFDNSTTRDGVKDDKAQDEEEPLEELTDGKLEEVEKLKSWEVFLKGGGGTEEGLPHEEGEIAGKKNMHSLTGRYQNPTKHRKGHFANTNTGKDAVEGTPRIPTSREGAFQDTKDTKHMTHGDHVAVAERVATDNPEYAQFMTDVSPKERLGSDTDKRVPTKEELNQKFYERTQPEKKQRRRASPAALAARRARMKSWELWLEKYDKDPNPEETDPEKIMQNAEVVGRKDNPMIKDMYKSWLEKMQGAGDARYGNQHLTGMEQHPVDDDESIDLSAESDKNNEKHGRLEQNHFNKSRR